MDNIRTFTQRLGAVAWGLLFILWGLTILFKFVPFGVGLLGTGLILIGVNVLRALNGLSARNDNTLLGILALAWGAMELARPVLHRLFASADLDWAIFAVLLVVLGLFLLTRELLGIRRAGVGNPR